MAIISPSTFDALNNYVGMRLQQGVPIVDADWNEMDDIRRFELRAFLKWFIGDGIPNGNTPGGNTAFRIEPLAAPAANNFLINGGATGAADPLGNMGRALVDGQEVRIPATVEFRQQPLHASKGAAATDLANRLGVPVIPELAPVAAPEAHNVYLDVWERLVTPAQQPALVLPGVGTESCARLRREWVVRVRPAPAAPASPIPVLGNADYQPGHAYLLLAQITRKPSSITAADIRDNRRTGLSLRAQGERLDRLEQLLMLPAFTPPPGEFSPVAGRAGVQIVTLSGRNFAVGTPTVEFGGIAAPVTSFTATQIVVTVPAGLAVGTIPIRVTTQGGSVTATNLFNVLPPQLPAFSPPPGEFTPVAGRAGIQVVTLNGSNFTSGTPTVQFGGTPAVVTSFTGTQIVVTVPAGLAVGSVPIRVTTTNGSVTATNLFNVIP